DFVSYWCHLVITGLYSSSPHDLPLAQCVGFFRTVHRGLAERSKSTFHPCP
ncbi:uncharacterized protein BJ212DRAFT_1377232, partial [Suillus subaureus]